MTGVVTHTQWSVTAAEMRTDEEDFDTVAVSLLGLGANYVVACSGPKGMDPTQFITALRAATAALIHAVGGDMSAVGAATPDDAMMDTGDQRAS
jgi:hypothetical protein